MRSSWASGAKTTAKAKTSFKIKKNHNYTISVIDPQDRSLVFRDLRGFDLEFLDQIFEYDSEKGVQESKIDYDQVCLLLTHLLESPSGFDISKLTKRDISAVFSLVRDNIICNYVPKVNWLKYCYGIQNGSFANLEQMEAVPMSKFIVMVEIHKEAIEQISSETNTEQDLIDDGT